MANYIAHHTKKKQILARNEANLRRLVNASAPATKLITAAVDVRNSRIRVLRVTRSLIAPKGNMNANYEKIDRRIEQVDSTSVVEILAEFGCDIETVIRNSCRGE